MRGRRATRANVLIASANDADARFSSTAVFRRLKSMRGISRRTGHTSRHAPHSVLAEGSSFQSFKPFSPGVITEPTGPAYVSPYTWPPMLL
jgi:hypothetical protein